MPEKPTLAGTVTFSNAVAPLLEWNTSSAAVTGVISSLATGAQHLAQHDTAHGAWFDAYALLLCDYISSVLPALPPTLSTACRGGVSALTTFLLTRLGQVSGDREKCQLLAAGVLALVGGEQLSPNTRIEQQKILADTSLASPHVSGEHVAEELATGLPQTDLTAGLLECLASQADINLPAILVSLNTGPALVSLVLSLPHLVRYVAVWRDVSGGGDLSIPAPLPDTIPALASEVSLATKLLSLPLFNPVSMAEVSRMASVSMGCLLAGISATGLSPDLSMSDTLITMVSDAISLSNSLTALSRSSTRIGAATAMNLTSSTAWLLLSGLRPHLSTPPPVCSPLTVALASHTLTCLSSLTEDLGCEPDFNCPPASLDLSGDVSGLARLKLVFGCAPTMQLLLQLATQLYLRARAGLAPEQVICIPDTVHNMSEGETDDTELLLGQWMTNLLAPSESISAPPTTPMIPSDSSPVSISYLSLSSKLLSWISTALSSSHPYMKANTSSSLSPDLIHCLSSLLLESSSDTCSSTLPAWPQFSTSLSNLTHHLISAPLPDQLTSLLLSDLSICPSAPVSTPWPLSVPRRSLSILAQVLLTRQSAEGSGYSPIVTTQYVTIWERAVTSLANAALSPDSSPDLTISNIHLLLLTFHSLQLMQKKNVLLTASKQLTMVCYSPPSPPTPHYCLLLARLAMLVDYMVRHLYEPPPTLLPQIRQNLFSRCLTNQLSIVSPSELDILPGEESTYYLLLSPPNSSLHSTDVPKLDGLAVSFLLSTPDMLDYPALYSALISSLQPIMFSKTGKPGHYCFLIVWRLLQALPPPAPLLTRLVQLAAGGGDVDVGEQAGYGLTLHCMVLAPRAQQKNFGSWMKDCLVKQGLTTAAAEMLLKTVATEVNSLTFEVCLIKEYMEKVEGKLELELADLLLLDCLMAKLQISLDKTFNNGKTGTLEAAISLSPIKAGAEWTGSLPSAVEAAQHLVPSVARLLEKFSQAARSKVINTFLQTVERGVEAATNSTLLHSMCLGGTRCPATASLALPITAHLPPALRAALEDWTGASITSYPPASAWRNQFAGDPIPGESYLATTISAHTSHLSSTPTLLASPALKHSLFSAARFACDLIIWCPESGPLQQQLVSALFPLLLDCTTENLADLVTLSLERLVGTGETDQFLSTIYTLVIQHSYPILVCRGSTQPHHASGHIPQEIVRFLDIMLDKAVGRAALHSFFTSNPTGPKLTEVLLSLAGSSCLSPEYAQRVLRFFNKLFTMAERHKEELGTLALCRQLAGLVEVPRARLEGWLRYLVVGMFQSGSSNEEETLHENRTLLQSLTAHIVRESSGVPEQVPLSILGMLVPLATELLSPTMGSAVGFPDLMAVMAGLAGAGGGKGHITLFPAAMEWLEVVKQIVVQKNVVEKLENGVSSGRHTVMLDNCSHLLNYISDIIIALKYGGGRWGIPSGVDRPNSPTPDGELMDDLSWTEEVPEDDESGGEDSDDEALDGKLCTYIQTARVFMSQHWYHCHTCGMVEGVGCCSVCARVCHRDHDVTYSKHGSFFCDCGAKEDGSCSALSPRLPLGDDSKRKTNTFAGFETVRHRAASPRKEDWEGVEQVSSHQVELARQIDSHRYKLLESLSGSSCISALLELSKSLAPVLESGARAAAPLGAMARLRTALTLLRTEVKANEGSDQLVLPTLGSQEGAFENVKMNFSGEQGQTIRQLLNAHMIRRGIMCCLSSPGGRRQHLAVAHEKGKITVLQLSALLKQADSSQKKLTLTRLSSAPVPFTVLSLVSNPSNENFLAVCGLKDCHVLTFNSSGGVSDQLVLQPQLEAANYIIKPVWLPGSQTQLAVVTADSVKIYDLASDALSPAYYFLVPSGKIRDVTFVHTVSGDMFLLLMSSAGHIYFQQLCDESSARHGSFYVTNIMDVSHGDVRDSGGSLAGGGVSIYYSHTLQMLFCSYAQGKSFMAPLTQVTEELSTVFPIQVRSNGAAPGKNSAPQVLCGWGEVPGHPGLITCVLQQAGNPVILMVEPDRNTVQEIKVGTKSKIMDMVAIRHLATGASAQQGEEKTTLILLCEDGSLKIYMAGNETTGYWLQPNLQPAGAVSVVKPSKKKRTTKVLRSTGNHNFPQDFFEHCQQQTGDLEFSGQDILQVYNVGQVKQRLQTSGLYVANTKPGGFSMDISNTDTNTVMVAVRVLLGTQDVTRVPSSLEVFGRSTHITLLRPRWIEFCFTREESIQCQNKIIVNFGATQDPGGVNMIDSIQVWTKTKEAFGWPEDSEEYSAANVATTNSNDIEEASVQPLSMTAVDKVVVTTLETLDAALVVCDSSQLTSSHSSTALEVATRLLVAPGPAQVQRATRSVLAALHPTKTTCHAHTDSALLKHATQILKTPNELDVEQFHNLVATARSIAVARPGNLVKFAETHDKEVEDFSLAKPGRCRSEECQRFIDLLSSSFWRLLEEIPANASSGCLGQPGLTHIEVTVQSLVEIFHAFTLVDIDTAAFAANHYIKFLLCPDQRVAFPARAALVRAIRPRPRRRRILPTPPSNPQWSQGTPRGTPEARPAAPAPPQRHSPIPNNARRPPGFQQPEFNEARDVAALNIGPGGIQLGGVAGNLEALLPMARGNLPAMLDHPDVDDEAMVELAIALSLQDQGDGGVLQQGLQGLQQLANLGQGLAGILGGRAEQEDSDGEEQGEAEEAAAVVDDTGHYSDTTASAPGSDDEGSIGGGAQGAEHEGEGGESEGGAAGSDSGGSIGDSIGVENMPVSGRSSAYDSSGVDGGRQTQREEVVDVDPETDSDVRLGGLRQILIEKLVANMGKLREVGGARCIPYMQLALALAADLDQADGRDKAALFSLLSKLVQELGVGAEQGQDKKVTEMANRSEGREFQLVIMRLLSVLMSRTRSPPVRQPLTAEAGNFVSKTTASVLAQSGTVAHNLKMLKSIVAYWQGLPIDDGITIPGSKLLRPSPPHPPPDMAPFFLKQYVKSHANDVFEAYPQLLTEMALRIPYQMKKISESGNEPLPHFDQAWFYQLCELMITPQAPFVKRQVRKLLLLICGSKEQYRQLRDMHTLETRIREVKITVAKGGFDFSDFEGGSVNLLYDTLIQLIEQLKACVEVAESRTLNWQKFCMSDETVLPFLLQVSYLLDNGVSPLVLQLLQSALCPPPKTEKPSRSKSSSPVKAVRKDKSRSEEPEEEGTCASDESLCVSLVQQLSRVLSPRPAGALAHPGVSILAKFIEKFLLECNTTSARWQAHALVVSLHSYSAPLERQYLLGIMWDLWRKLPEHGRRAAQFVDLLGFFSVAECRDGMNDAISMYASSAVSMLRSQNSILSSHANSAIYTSLSQLVDFTGYYLESDPCLVCNNPEVSFSNLKLSSLKVDTKFTTGTQMVKLSGSHSISKILLRIGDLKRQKMVRSINMYYNNRTVQAVVELKNKPTMWHLAKKITLTSGQTDLKVEFPLPIVACNIMIEYSDFYENIQAVGESLQCPRCSASVPANPGVCSNCGENVFQCHKCRAINYDEKDPFLCNSCGFCKYAKFEYSLTARPCCAVDPIENEEDRKKALANINTLLEKADKVYRQLIANKPELEHLLIKVSDGSDVLEESSGTGSPVNKSIHQLGQKYCVECKNSFEELSKLIQRVMATRLELISFDKSRSCGLSEPTATPQVERKLSGGVGGLRVGSCGATCYGCATACVEHCLTLLRALATKQITRPELHQQDLVSELLDNNLRRGAASTRSSVQALICLLTRNNHSATEKLNSLLYSRLSGALAGGDQLLAPVRHEVTLLSAIVKQKDTCWESRLRTVIKLFLAAAKRGNSPAIMDAFTLPCLNILQDVIRSGSAPPAAPRKKDKDKSNTPESDQLESSPIRPTVDVRAWLKEEFSFSEWKHEFEVVNGKKVVGKYFARWRNSVAERKWAKAYGGLAVMRDRCYLKQILFNRSCRSGRQVAANLVQYFIENGPQERKKEMIDSLTEFLVEVGEAGEASEEFMELYKKLVSTGDWRYYLAVKGVLQLLAKLISKEIVHFGRLEQTRLSSDLALGYAVKQLTALLSSLLQHGKIKMVYKSRLVSDVLGGYLSLRRLVVQRTKMIDETQDSLLELLEDLTTGTEEETRAFMSVCIETVGKYPADDQLTPTFIFERLCSIIFPEEADTGEFFLTLEKDPQQEEFLQGRMLGNPYSSKEPGLGPLMREVKNKICTDCELVALLEDDNGMELLVNNKIISLDLPVKDVYNKVWLPEAGEGEPMRVVYRMRGLLGDATEEFIESLDKKDGETSDDEVTYKLAVVMGECGGLKVILNKLAGISSLGNKTLISVLLKLLGYCCKLKFNRELLLNPSLNATATLLGTLQLCLAAGESQTATVLTETVLQLMEKLLVEAVEVAHQSVQQYQAFAGSATAKDITSLLDHAVHIKPGTDLHHHLMRVLPFLTYANRDNMELVINHFTTVLDFSTFDAGHSAEDEARLEAWVAMCVGIERNGLGNTMKDELVRLGIVSLCTDYIKMNSPPTKQVLPRTDDPAWKEFAMKPSVKYILRGLAGLAADHPETQTMLADTIISQLHLMEQMSSDEHLGSLAEAVLEALKGHKEAGEKVKAVRTATREEKKKMAMAMRAKQLKAIGLKTNDKGQVKAESSLLQQFQAIGEESGLACVICREGYRFQPGKVLAIYTFTRRAPLEEAERAVRKTMGYSTVSHFNLVHVDCHLAAVRQARARDEWESALLQNANTKCNGLLPLWGPGITESAYAACLARHNTYLAEVTGQRDISYQSTVHDIKLLISKFAQERSFSVESGGGGPQSNLHLLPYLAHMALYVINTTRAGPRETANIKAWLRAAPTQWVDQSTSSDGPLYFTTLSLLLLSPTEWADKRVAVLQRLLVTTHVRSGPPTSKVVLEYSQYRHLLLFWAMVDLLMREMWAGVTTQQDQDWSCSLAEWIRGNDETILARSSKILTQFQEDLVQAQDLLEVMDVCGLLGEIPSPASAILEVVSQLP